MNLGTAFVEMMAFKKVHFYFQNARTHTHIYIYSDTLKLRMRFCKFPTYPNFPKDPYTSLRDHPKPKEHEGYLLQLKSSEQQLRRRSSAASEAAPGRAERKTTGHAERRDSREAAKGSETCFKIG